MIEEFTVTACESNCNSIPKAIFLRIPVRFYKENLVFIFGGKEKLLTFRIFVF
jgi:hypothetical protein